ncbi:MAG: hypothetical protein GXO96_01285 [Nitrospirae bacterium]|nr:hypothetical protein [Candidatus Manganitrophaceae bacterium]
MNQDHIALAERAANGDADARLTVNQMAHPMIRYQTQSFCKRFCKENRALFICTLDDAWASASKGTDLCEWGNGSYGWMLDDLTKPQRLHRFEGREGAGLNHYFYAIANSQPFYERWKDWRFGRKVHVPTYIQTLNPKAAQLFLALRASDPLPLIAQKIGESLEKTEKLCHQMIALLTQKNRLHLLNPEKTISLTTEECKQEGSEDDTAQEKDLPFFDESPESREEKQKIRKAWTRLTTLEQYILEALLIEEQDASDILAALKKLKITIKKGVSPEDTNRQQLYYFKRKSLAKLANLMEKV